MKHRLGGGGGGGGGGGVTWHRPDTKHGWSDSTHSEANTSFHPVVTSAGLDEQLTICDYIRFLLKSDPYPMCAFYTALDKTR